MTSPEPQAQSTPEVVISEQVAIQPPAEGVVIEPPAALRTDDGRPQVVEPQIQQVTFGPNGSSVIIPNETGRT